MYIWVDKLIPTYKEAIVYRPKGMLHVRVILSGLQVISLYENTRGRKVLHAPIYCKSIAYMYKWLHPYKMSALTSTMI